MIKAYLIDPVQRAVTQVELTAGDSSALIHQMQELIGGYFDLVYLNEERDAIYYRDDPGFRGDTHAYFSIEGYELRLDGKALVLGHEEGKPTAPTFPMEMLRRRVRFG